MTRTLTTAQVRRLRARAQRLGPEARRDAAAVGPLVRSVCGLQGQELAAATLGVRARSAALTAETVRQAREDDRTLVLTWAMRGTLHLLAAADARWLLPFFGPLFIKQGARRFKQLGLADAALRDRAAAIMLQAVRERGPLTRAELTAVLAAQHIPVEGQAIFHLIRYAALAGHLCYGPLRDGELTLVPLLEWVGEKALMPLDEGELLARLARRYLAAYGPATANDFATWAGIGVRQARAGFGALGDDRLAVAMGEKSGWLLQAQTAWLDESRDDVVVRLLPRYDGYLLGYQSRAFLVADENAKRIHPGGGILRQTLLVDGAAAGIWRLKRKTHHAVIEVEPFAPLSEAVLTALDAEAADVGRFLGIETRLAIIS